jgi:hypothetical protein
MGTTKLSALPARRSKRPATAATVYAGFWAATLSLAALTASVGPLGSAARTVLALRLSPPRPDFARVLELTAHNLPVAVWPVLLGATGARYTQTGRRIGDVLVIASLSASVAPVGVALGAYGTELVPFLPQLPLEWAGLAAGANGWLAHRQLPPHHRQLTVTLLTITALLLGAGALETYAVPYAKPGGGHSSPPLDLPVSERFGASRLRREVQRHGRHHTNDRGRLVVLVDRTA